MHKSPMNTISNPSEDFSLKSRKERIIDGDLGNGMLELDIGSACLHTEGFKDDNTLH